MRSQGLVVLDVDNGQIDDRRLLSYSVEKSKKPYPVLWDRGAKTIAAYRVGAYPTAYLIGADGTVLWNGIPDPTDPRRFEKMIKEALEEVDLEALREAKSPFLGKAVDEGKPPTDSAAPVPE